jgi:putative dehydrogenase
MRLCRAALPGQADGTMSVMLGLCRCRACKVSKMCWIALSSKVFRISERPGDGARTKLVNNLLAGINLVGAAEALALAHRLGPGYVHHAERHCAVQRAKLDRVRPHAPCDSGRLRATCPCHIAGQGHAPRDGRGRREAGFDGPLGHSTRDTFAQALAQGFADWDDAAILRVMMSPRRGA